MLAENGLPKQFRQVQGNAGVQAACADLHQTAANVGIAARPIAHRHFDIAQNRAMAQRVHATCLGNEQVGLPGIIAEWLEPTAILPGGLVQEPQVDQLVQRGP